MIRKLKDYLLYFYNEYAKTVAITLLCVFVIIVSMLVFMQNEIYQQRVQEVTQDEEFEYYLVGVLIDKNKYIEQKEPTNYKVNIKLGILYEIIKDYAEAESQFKKAKMKAPYGEYMPQYRLASLYIRQNKLDIAEAIFSKIPERDDKDLIKFKAEIYLKLADKYYAMGDYRNAIAKYKKSAFYFKIVKKSAIKEINNSLASSYVYLAEKNLSERKIEEAIESFVTAKSYVDAPIIRYKLALLQIKDNPSEAYKNFERVFKEEPSILNYEIYYNFLTELSIEAESRGDTANAGLYSYKAKKFKEYYFENILSVKDLAVDSSFAQRTYNIWKNEYKFHLQIKLRNTSAEEIKNLFLNADFKLNDKLITSYNHKIISQKHPLKSGLSTDDIDVVVFYKPEYKLNKNDKITAEVSVSKLENSYKMFIETLEVQEVKKDKKMKINL